MLRSILGATCAPLQPATSLSPSPLSFLTVVLSQFRTGFFDRALSAGVFDAGRAGTIEAGAAGTAVLTALRNCDVTSNTKRTDFVSPRSSRETSALLIISR